MGGEIKGSFRNRSFFEQSIGLDGSSFRDCVFTSCSISYCGGEIPSLSGCRFDGCTWQFGGPAANTIAFLSGMHRGGFDRLIEATFEEIRRGATLSQPAPPPDDRTEGLNRLLKPLRIFRIPKPES
ncbi:hypothetical protein [Hoeflea olei]|uniref:Pentapeptide repeat-containing protein n=1 Tax=Hoeflea olei TaxID=1480615 RepID=A0A1C1YTQ1_9HYPH|nr:hypothetical protein [Hoeflea olei]OCW56919.1 hypothetical protein AWJ14_07095 [Hoeflea olei]